MTDRDVQYPNRYKMTKVEGTDDIVELTPAPGVVTAEGDFINKKTLLQDDTAAMYGKTNMAVPDDIFKNIFFRINMIMTNMAMMTLTLKTAAGNPLADIPITNLLDDQGNPARTNSSGVATGYMSEGNVTLSITGYADIQDISKTYTIVKGETYTDQWTVTVRDFFKITSTRNVKFSKNVSLVDVTVLGAGGGGGAGYRKSDTYESRSGAGGAAGDVVESKNIEVTPEQNYQAVIGAGGTGGSNRYHNDSGTGVVNGTAGGTSSFLGVSAPGGVGATSGSNSSPGIGSNGNGGAAVYGKAGGNGSPGNGISGGSGIKSIYSSFTETVLSGGGGASGSAASYTIASGGNPGGGTGGHGGGSIASNINSGVGGNGVANTGGGGGGGGAKAGNDDGNWDSSVSNGGNGGSGCVAIRIHLIAA